MGSLLIVFQDLIGFADLFEAGLGSRLLIDIRMEFSGEPAIGLLDLVRRRVALDSENLVIVLVFHEVIPILRTQR